MHSYQDIFEKTNMPPLSREEDHEIIYTPPVRGIGRLSEDKLINLKQTFEELLEKGFIRPSMSPFGAMILFARKQDVARTVCALTIDD